MPVPGDLLLKDPDAELFYVMNWTAWFASGATIATSAWAIESGDGALTFDNATILSGNLKTRLRLIGGTVGERYTVRNRVTTNETPDQVDDRSITIAVVER